MTVSVNPSVNGGAQASQSSQGGTVTNTGGSLTSNDVLLGAGGDDLKRVPGISSDGASKVKLGVAGTSVGGVELRNATSGSVTIQPVTGALGTRTLLAPAADGTLATTQNISDSLAGLSWKIPCRVATTVAGTLATSFENGDTVDGVVLATNDRILIKDQAAGAENGLYVVQASGAPVRTTDADNGTEMLAASVLITAGTTNANRQYTCNTPATITLGSTALTFVQINSSGGSMATDPLWQVEGDLAVGSGSATAVRLPKGSALQVLRRNAGNTALEYADPAATSGGVVDSTAAEVLALTTGDEGVIHHANSSSGDVVEDSFYAWNEDAGELHQFITVTPAEGAALSDGYQGLKTWAAMQALTAVEGMTCSVDMGNTIAYWRYSAAGLWLPLGGLQLVHSLKDGDAGQTAAPGGTTETLLAGCQVTLPLKALAKTGAKLWVVASVQKEAGNTESPVLNVRLGSSGTAADGLLAGGYTLTAGSARGQSLTIGATRVSTTSVQLTGAGSITQSARFTSNFNTARPAAITDLGNMDSTTNYLSLFAVGAPGTAEWLVATEFDVYIKSN